MIGGQVRNAVQDRPNAAVWVANLEDGRFGRLVVEVVDSEDDQTRYLASSRTLFADSFYSALSVIWGGHQGTSAFREGDVLLTMSMDPFDLPEPEAAEDLERRLRQLQVRAEAVEEDDLATQYRIFVEFQSLMVAGQLLPRRVVVHPALYGRELAWSAIRVDFWFGSLDSLDGEISMANGGLGIPRNLRQIDLQQAGTWQFFERDASVGIEQLGEGVGQLRVRSSGPDRLAPSDRSHFAVSMFAIEEMQAIESEGRRLRELESELQPLLDWLAVNHHDFMRLNDYSESFSLLRWLRRSEVAPLLLDIDGEAAEIATPDRMVPGSGPALPGAEPR